MYITYMQETYTGVCVRVWLRCNVDRALMLIGEVTLVLFRRTTHVMYVKVSSHVKGVVQ